MAPNLFPSEIPLPCKRRVSILGSPKLTSRWRAVIVAALLAVLLQVPVAEAATKVHKLSVSQLSVHSGGTWGGDLVTIRGDGFLGTHSRVVAAVLFGAYLADSYDVINETTIQAFSPQIPNQRTAADVRVVLGDKTTSPRTPADVFTFMVPTLDTPTNGHWSANQSRAISDAMMGRAPALQAAPVAPNPGYWTPSMGHSAVQRAAGWLGMPYAWAGGSSTGPTLGSCSGDGAINLDCSFRGFDCSGLTMYAWSRYERLAHFAATQLGQAGSFHPALGELQPGDLMFFSGGGPVISHVVMYAGQGRVIQSSESGWPVRYSTLADVMSSHPRYFGATRPMSRGVQAPAPVVTSISVTRSATRGGARITIRGSKFDTASQVYFGGTSTYNFVINSANSITASIPANDSGTADVRVYNAWGESAVERRAVLTYFGKPRLTAMSLRSTGVAGGSTIILTGTNFSPGTRVYFGTTAATAVHVLSSTHLSVVTPPQVAGVAAVRVTTPYGASNPRGITYVAAQQAPTPTPSGNS